MICMQSYIFLSRGEQYLAIGFLLEGRQLLDYPRLRCSRYHQVSPDTYFVLEIHAIHAPILHLLVFEFYPFLFEFLSYYPHI